jgi:hypothetical protein
VQAKVCGLPIVGSCCIASALLGSGWVGIQVQKSEQYPGMHVQYNMWFYMELYH